MDLNSAIEILRGHETRGSYGTRKVTTFETLEACNVVLPWFKQIASEQVQTVLYDEYKQIGFSLNSFYNETVEFIVRGKPRGMNISQWQSIMVAYANDLKGVDKPKWDAAGVNMLRTAWLGINGTVRDYGVAHQSSSVNSELLSYADHELFDLWISRPNGITDMARAMSIILYFTHP